MDLRNREGTEPSTALDGATIRELLHPKNAKLMNQSIAEAMIKPGTETKEHYHAKSEEVYYILKGRGRLKIGNEFKEVKEMDAILIPPKIRHRIKNIGNDDLIFLCCCSPAYSDRDIFGYVHSKNGVSK